MIRPSVRSAGLVLLLTMSGCGAFVPSGTATRTPGLSVAEAALDGGAAEIALQVSDGVLLKSPNDLHALTIKGDALTLLGDYDQAGKIFQQVLAKDPASLRAGIGLGRVELARNPAVAEVLFQRVLQRDPRNVTALNNLGIARDLQGHHVQAQPAYREALALNPDLESAQVNLALSLAMDGQGPAAIKLLQAKADAPGAASKVRHDYAVVLAMAGHRADAERVLSSDMAPDEARQLLDSATGTHARASNVAVASADDDVPPDVVQVPDADQAQVAPARLARGPAPRGVPVAAAPPPEVIRPQADTDPGSDAPMVQPTDPIAAAVTNPRPLAAPLHATVANPAPIRKVAARPAEPPTLTPEVVPLPATQSMPARAIAAALPVAPPPQPVLQPAPLPPAYQPVPASAQPAAVPADEAAARVNAARESARAAAAQTAGQMHAAPGTTVMAAAAIAPEHRIAPEVASATIAREAAPTVVAPPAAPAMSGDATGLTIQLAATPSSESAHSFWQVLVHRFPAALAQREPVVIRYEHNGAVFWRLRAEGFASLSQAQTLCAQIRAGGQACFVPRS